jgi:hypothetical protein
MFDFIARLPPFVVNVIGVIGFSLYVMNYCLSIRHFPKWKFVRIAMK